MDVPASNPPKLLDRVREAIRTRHYSRRTEVAYVTWIRRYIGFHHLAHPSALGAAGISVFLTWLATKRHVSASTQNQALAALLFLYERVLEVPVGRVEHVARARQPLRLPVVLSREEVAALLSRLDGVMWIIGVLLYGSGLRLNECLALRVKDVDFDRCQIAVRRGKGQKDRTTMLPGAAVHALRRHLAEVQRRHAADLAEGLGRAVLPDALERKYPTAATAWGWQFVFPASRICRDPRWGPPSRFHLHESTVQKAIAAAARQAGVVNEWVPTRFVTASRLICSRMATTFARFRSCWDTRTSARRWCTRMC
jgi:integron integrase